MSFLSEEGQFPQFDENLLRVGKLLGERRIAGMHVASVSRWNGRLERGLWDGFRKGSLNQKGPLKKGSGTSIGKSPRALTMAWAAASIRSTGKPVMAPA